MSTENVAILFTDIVGSTELSQRLSAEMADEVRREHFSILRQAIAEAGGTEVKNLGDGLMVGVVPVSWVNRRANVRGDMCARAASSVTVSGRPRLRAMNSSTAPRLPPDVSASGRSMY